MDLATISLCNIHSSFRNGPRAKSDIADLVLTHRNVSW